MHNFLPVYNEVNKADRNMPFTLRRDETHRLASKVLRCTCITKKKKMVDSLQSILGYYYKHREMNSNEWNFEWQVKNIYNTFKKENKHW